MNEEIRRIIIFTGLALVWAASIFLIIDSRLGLATPVFPRPQPDYELITMLISGAMLVLYSFKTGIAWLRT
jgi:hypothetical protein